MKLSLAVVYATAMLSTLSTVLAQAPMPTPTPMPPADVLKRQGTTSTITLVGGTACATATVGLPNLSASICVNVALVVLGITIGPQSCLCTPTPTMGRRQEQVLVDGDGNVRIGVRKRQLIPAQLCSSRLTGCKVDERSRTPGLKIFEGDKYACKDLENDVESCGGCVSEGNGQDCTGIANVEEVQCIAGVCTVHSCEPGFSPSVDQTYCELDVMGRKRGMIGRSLVEAQKFWL